MKHLLHASLIATLLAPAAAHAQFGNLFGGEKKKTTIEEAAKKKRVQVVEKTTADIDGDGTTETVGACAGSDKQIKLCVFGENDDGAVLKHMMGNAGGKKLRFVKAEDLIPEVAGTEVILEVYDETPDEKVKQVRVYAGYPEPREIFKSVIFRSKNAAKRAAWEAPDVVHYGDARPGWYFFDTNEDGSKEIMVRRRAKIVGVKRRGEKPAKLLVGVNEAVYEFTGDPSTGAYRERGETYFNDFLQPGYEVEGVRASSTWIEPGTLRELQSEAMAAAVYAEGGKTPNEVKVDRAPFTEKVADKSFDTGWVEDGKGFGADEWVEISLTAPQKIHMVRIVPGCLESKSVYRKFNVPTKVQIQLDGKPFFVNLARPDKPEPPVVAMSASKIPGKTWAKQYFVFFDGEREAKNIKLVIEGVKRQGNGKNTCVAELSAH